jgi:hypothetical protein
LKGWVKDMKVKDYLKSNTNKIAYTIKDSKKSYLCNIFEANSYFGNNDIKKIAYKYNNEQLPILYLQ